MADKVFAVAADSQLFAQVEFIIELYQLALVDPQAQFIPGEDLLQLGGGQRITGDFVEFLRREPFPREESGQAVTTLDLYSSPFAL